MNYRYMRVIVFFDLPVTTAKERRAYTMFRKHLIKSGFVMMQESVYCKLVSNGTAADAVTENMRKNKPSDGIVQVLRVTESQFAKMEYMVGGKSNDYLDTDERLVII